MVRYCDPIIGNNTVYCKYGVSEVYSYHMMVRLLTSCSYSLIIDEGNYGRRWTKKFSPMPTRRYNVSALCTGTALIVAGGWGHGGKDEALKIVEVLKIETQQWHTAVVLPQPLSYSSLTLW